MSKIDKIFYEWDNHFFDLDFKLGDDISVLLKNKKLRKVDNEETGEIEFEGVNGIPNRIVLKENKIVAIWLSGRVNLPNNNSLFELPMENLLPQLNKRLKSLNEKISRVEDLKDYNESDVLYFVFRDFFVTLVGILKRKK
ncbi:MULTISPECIES: hypothetical protein [unclassified Arenibacter]|uniref:hypothetical protein n=1 Tax=unclassified Arenibacter TaxID=2615047 RepID=UPI000E34E387|nr:MULTISPECIES: hypothetical protein [unclassified Arenibacter]MCM4166044.1 hypothetical protein [Arenibacter sp. A80]RFT54314.1 hypothetical protein D0S24_20780 [Arenibacter sp. P308M17]